ncbi:hypothetical protein SAMN04488543_1010 [Friedmanniella luteola]|uniref:Uncharacterized protein n=1 Tax=Friedmanniella luteola TaxID=546871 RepID=A0A1H1P737_9ACTN|nr:hypothetical protein [Friedmanniella luteola]SDS07051.1 hypothetical protein SAMN04488543_1010 [Friedmanniella luteola]
MRDDVLREALVRLYTADYGAHCPLTSAAAVLPGCGSELRARCRAELQARLRADADGLRVWLAQTARELFLSEPALRRGLGLEDAADFWGWFDRALWAVPGSGDGPGVQRPPVGAATTS